MLICSDNEVKMEKERMQRGWERGRRRHPPVPRRCAPATRARSGLSLLGTHPPQGVAPASSRTDYAFVLVGLGIAAPAGGIARGKASIAGRWRRQA